MCPYVPLLAPENSDAIFVWSMTQDQLRTAGMDGVPFAPDHNAIWTFMDRFGIEDQQGTFQKVIFLFSHFIKKMQEDRKNG